MLSGNTKTIFTSVIAIVAWFAILLQLYLLKGTITNFFSFFTIECNLLVAVSTTFVLLAPSSKVGMFFSKLSVQTAIALYIFIVALVYNTVLRGLVPLAGWDLVADTLLHVVVPIFYMLYWFICKPAGGLEWKDGFYWVIFPTAYLTYSLIRGAMVNWYPYPFLNAAHFGYGKVATNVAIMIAVFFITGILLIAATRSSKRKG